MGIPMGDSQLSIDDIRSVIVELEEAYPGSDYDLLRKNCCTFSNEMCILLGVGKIPQWILSLAATGAQVADTTNFAVARTKEVAIQAKEVAIGAAGQAKKIDEKFGISETAAQTAQKTKEKACELDEKYKIRD